jgi:hypothetical protein
MIIEKLPPKPDIAKLKFVNNMDVIDLLGEVYLAKELSPNYIDSWKH